MGRLETCSKQLLSVREELAEKCRDLLLLQQDDAGPEGGSSHGGQCDCCEVEEGAAGAIRTYDLCEPCWSRLGPGGLLGQAGGAREFGEEDAWWYDEEEGLNPYAEEFMPGGIR